MTYVISTNNPTDPPDSEWIPIHRTTMNNFLSKKPGLELLGQEINKCSSMLQIPNPNLPTPRKEPLKKWKYHHVRYK